MRSEPVYKRNLILPILFLFVFMAVPVSAFQLGEGVALPVPVPGLFNVPKWAPDGSGLAFTGERYTGLYYTDLAGNVSVISDAKLAGWRYQWSPDGQSLIYRIRSEDGMGLALMQAKRGEAGSKQLTPFLNDLFPPRCGKDGITYRSGDELITLDEEGNVISVHSLSQGRGVMSRVMSVAANLMLGRITGATFTSFACALSSEAADGKPGSGVYVDSESQIWIVDENGNRRKLIDVEGEPGYCPPTESPQGDKYCVEGYSGNLYVVDPRGGTPVNLGEGHNPSWSPDGRYVIFEVTTDDGHIITSSDLWIASIDGSQRFQLTSTPGIEADPSWSPDGKYIAYILDGKIYIAPIEP
ncbi:MAG: hypothetical protein K6T99_00115 [Armatimonadetes bacterium]|nr:hypothetical protein [Armatimonadota bacterium]